jgi:predicted MPP superfamily phosphohydrolase
MVARGAQDDVYLQNELLMAMPLALYVAWRVTSLIKPRFLKIAWIVSILALAAGYPLAETLSHGSGDGLAEAVILAGYCALPLLLYVIMAVIASDVVVGALRLAGVLRRETVRSPRVRRARLALGLGLPALVVAYGAVNHRVLRVKEYRFDIARRASTAEQLTVVFMADLHFRGLTPDGLLDDLVAKVNAQDPDIILVGGDMLEGDRRDEDTGRYERAFRRMTSRYGIYAVPGNHERHALEGGGAFLDRAGIRLLEDEAVPIDRAFALAGRKDVRGRNRLSVAALVAAAPPDLPVILLVHRPSDFDQAVRAGVAIQLSGHTHHGQLFPANLVTSREYPLSWGHIERGGTHFVVTSGVQGWGPPVRTVGASEIVVLRLDLRD